ncbi:MAG TPA: sorbosone dehydrogenase family protein [Vicinamibacterales bacterium]|jgi:glucose/arabinose dehydrogenase|nr:sorbosone dehydrogenase family protein [Vicinamibacterales bacterium]
MRIRSARRLMVCAGLMAGGFLTFVPSRFLAAPDDRPKADQKGVFSDYRSERPGVVHKITVADLPAPFATESAQNNPRVVDRPEGAMPQTMPGYSVAEYATGFENPRLIRTAPNGDVFLAESRPGRIKVMRGMGADGRAQTVEVFATGLKRPFGIAFYPLGSNPKFVYVGNTDSVVRFPYKKGDLKARGPQEVIVPDLPSGGQLTGGGHWTRDIAFSRDGKKMYVSVGSNSNVDDSDTTPAEKDRATILEFTPEGKGRRIYVSGIRNAVGIAIHPKTGQLWASVNERDGLGDNLVPDYITRVKDGDFFGWPWFYMGGNQDPRHPGKRPELKAKVKTPDVLIEPHSASLEMVFYTTPDARADYRTTILAAQHGSWNKTTRTGYKVIRVPLKDGVEPTGEYEDFLTGFVTDDGQVWGRPVGVAVAKDGSLLVSDDGSNIVWRVSNTKK